MQLDSCIVKNNPWLHFATDRGKLLRSTTQTTTLHGVIIMSGSSSTDDDESTTLLLLSSSYSLTSTSTQLIRRKNDLGRDHELVERTGEVEIRRDVLRSSTSADPVINMDRIRNDAAVHCCAECGVEGGVSLKACMLCKLVKYCNANCQRNHWPKHKKECKRRAAELRDEALFKDPPAKEDCPICFLPMPYKLINCVSLPPATIVSVPVYDFAKANENKTLGTLDTETYYSCCGKSICAGCVHSFIKSGNHNKCPFCNADHVGKTDDKKVEDIMKRVDVNDAGAMYVLGSYYYHGQLGLSQNQEKAKELLMRAAELGSSQAHYNLGIIYDDGGDLKKAKFHYEAAAMAGHEVARNNLGCMEFESGKQERAVKHWTIAASAGCFQSMHHLRKLYEKGIVSRDEIDSTLSDYNKSCAEVRSEARDSYIRIIENEL